MKSSSTSGVCLATATTEPFVPGALVMLGSFLAHHPRFDGDLVIIHDALPQAARDALQSVSERMQSYRKRNPYYHFALAQVAFDRLSYGESVAFVERALELKRDDHRFHRLKGRAHEMLGEPEAAQASHALAERYERRKGIAPAARVGGRLL